MGTCRSPIHIVLTEEERARLDRLSRSQAVSHRTVTRANLILALAGGSSVSDAARRVGVQRRIARKWGQRFAKKRLDGLADAPRSGRPPRFSPRSGRVPREVGV